MDPYNTGGPGYGSVMGQAQMTKLQSLERKKTLLTQDMRNLQKRMNAVRAQIQAIEAEIDSINGVEKKVVAVTDMKAKPATRKRTSSRKRGSKTEKTQ